MAHLLRINVPSVTHQTIDGEVIILNLDNGFYYSLTDAAALIWQLCDGSTSESIVSSLVAHSNGEAAFIAAETERFLGELLAEELLRQMPVDGPVAASPTAEWPNDASPFTAPRLEKYTEMSDLLLIDPIHDVDAAGWPHIAPAPSPPISSEISAQS